MLGGGESGWTHAPNASPTSECRLRNLGNHKFCSSHNTTDILRKCFHPHTDGSASPWKQSVTGRRPFTCSSRQPKTKLFFTNLYAGPVNRLYIQGLVVPLLTTTNSLFEHVDLRIHRTLARVFVFRFKALALATSRTLIRIVDSFNHKSMGSIHQRSSETRQPSFPGLALRRSRGVALPPPNRKSCFLSQVLRTYPSQILRVRGLCSRCDCGSPPTQTWLQQSRPWPGPRPPPPHPWIHKSKPH